MLQRTGALLLRLLVVAMQLRQDTMLYGAPCRCRRGQSGRDKRGVFSMAGLYTLRVRLAWVALHHQCTMEPTWYVLWLGTIVLSSIAVLSTRGVICYFVLQALTHKLTLTYSYKFPRAEKSTVCIVGNTRVISRLLLSIVTWPITKLTRIALGG